MFHLWKVEDRCEKSVIVWALMYACVISFSRVSDIEITVLQEDGIQTFYNLEKSCITPTSYSGFHENLKIVLPFTASWLLLWSAAFRGSKVIRAILAQSCKCQIETLIWTAVWWFQEFHSLENLAPTFYIQLNMLYFQSFENFFLPKYFRALLIPYAQHKSLSQNDSLSLLGMMSLLVFRWTQRLVTCWMTCRWGWTMCWMI